MGTESLGLLCRFRKLAAPNATICSKHIGPPEKDDLEQARALPEILAFRQRLVVILALIEPGAVGRIAIAHFIAFQGRGVLRLDRLAELGEEPAKSPGELIRRLNPFAFRTGRRA